MLVDVKIPDLTDEEIVEIFAVTDPSSIPAEFIYLAKLITPQGQIMYLDGDEYRTFIDAHPVGTFVGNVELALNLDRFGQDVKDQTEKVLRKELSDDDHFSFDSGEGC